MGALISTTVGVIVAVGVLAAFFTGCNLAVNRMSQRWDDRIRPWVFVGPAMLFLFIGLVVPALRTIYLSFHGGRRGSGSWTLENYRTTLGDDRVISFSNIGNIFTSWLFIASVAMVAIAALAAWLSSRRLSGGGSAGLDFSAPSSMLLITAAVICVLMAIFSTLRGIIWNNLWWVAAVTGLSTVLGLGLAVLADRSRKETAAKTLIFMPMAISMVGAAIIWSYMYNIPVRGQSPGLLNEVLSWFGVKPVDFLRDNDIIPWNNFFIMIIMIWIQTGFAMVVLSAAIKSVPAELTEAAQVDGANDVQVFWRITVPQIVPTIVVVVTTTAVTVMKIFDLVKATTNGNFGTDVLANRMYDNLRDGNFTLSSTFAVIILVLVMPVMIFNFRRGQKEVAR
ncbi:MAG: carbohydrate ABC transporter permease [Acidimicrobiia bacterium]